MRVHLYVFSLLASGLGDCAHWCTFEPWDAQASGDPVNTDGTDGPVGTTGATGDPTITGTTEPPDPGTSGGPTTTSDGSTGYSTGSYPCTIAWEDCADGEDDNCDEAITCDGATRTHAILKPEIDALHVAPTATPGEFVVIGAYRGALDLPGAPLAADFDLFAFNYQAATATTFGATYLTQPGDQQIAAFRHTAGGRNLLVVLDGGSFDLREWKDGSFAALDPLAGLFTKVPALDGDGERIVVLGAGPDFKVYVQSFAPDGSALFSNPLDLGTFVPQDIRVIPDSGGATFVAGGAGLEGLLQRVAPQQMDGGIGQITAKRALSPDALVSRIAWDADPSTVVVAGYLQGLVDAGIAPGAATPLCGSDTCSSLSQDLFLARYSADTLVPIDAVRSRGAADQRNLFVRSLERDGAGQFVVAGAASGPLEFGDGTPTPVDPLAQAAAVVVKFGPTFTAAAEPYWTVAAVPGATSSSVQSIALDPTHVVAAGRFIGPLDLPGVQSDSPDDYAGFLLSLAP